MSLLQELLAQRAELDKKIAAEQQREREETLAKIRELIAQGGLSAADVFGKSTAGKPTKTSRSKVAAKYRDPASGQSWSGRGLQPKWLKAAIAAGKKLEDFAI